MEIEKDPTTTYKWGSFDGFVQSHNDMLNTDYGNLPDVIYHYTTAQGALGIISSDSIWATDARFLNDASELKYGIELAIEELDRDPNYATLNNLIKREIYETNSFKRMNTYVASFCQDKDLLSQWRGYGSKGCNFSIGLPTNIVMAGRELVQLRRVEYNRQRQIERIRLITKDYYKTLRGAKRPRDKSGSVLFLKEAVSAYAAVIYTCICLFKNPVFEEEQEYRLIVLSDKLNELKFRASNIGVIPYIELKPRLKDDMLKIPIREVCCGPSPNPLITQDGIKIFLAAAGHDISSIAIVSSMVPLRQMQST